MKSQDRDLNKVSEPSTKASDPAPSKGSGGFSKKPNLTQRPFHVKEMVKLRKSLEG